MRDDSSATIEANSNQDNHSSSSNGSTFPYTRKDLKEMENHHYNFHVKVLGTKRAVAKKIARNTIKPLEEEMAALEASA